MEISVHNSIINSPKVETTQSSIKWWWIHGLAYCWQPTEMEELILVITWMNCENTTSNEQSKSQRSILHDSIYIKHGGQACLQRQILDWRLPGAEGGGRPWVVAKGCRVSFRGWWKCSTIDCSHQLHLSRLRVTELHMLSVWILWYINYISIAFLKNPMAGSK